MGSLPGRALLLCLCGALLGLQGCGYQLAGRELPAASEPVAIWIAPVEDDGDEPLFGVRLAAALSREALNYAAFDLVPVKRADYQLRVVVDRAGERGAAFRVGDVVREYLLRGRATAYLTAVTGEVAWKGTAITAEREFAAGVDVNQTERNKAAAVELLAADLAREVLRRAALAQRMATP